MKDLLPYLVGAASAFAVQFLIQIYVVPHVETAKRHRERWEKDVLDLGALLTTTISDLAERALSAQLYVRRMATLTGPDFDQAKVEVELGKQQVAAREATRAFHSQVNFRSDWIMDRISTYRASDKVIEFTQASFRYRLHLMKPAPDDWEKSSDEDFDEWWDTERRLRTELTSQVKALAYARHPLRRSWRMRLRSLRYRASRRLAMFRRKPAGTKPEAQQ